MTTVTKVQGVAQITNDSGPKVTLGIRHVGPTTGTETDSGNNVIWNGKTYRITVVKKGKACNPTNPADWDKLKDEYLHMLDALDATLMKTDKSATSVLKGASRFSHSLTKGTLLAIHSDQKKRTIDLKKDFESLPEDSLGIQSRIDKVSTMIQSFNPTQAKKEPETTSSKKDPESGNTSDVGNVDSDEESSSSSSSTSSEAPKVETKKSKQEAAAERHNKRRAQTVFQNENSNGIAIPTAQTSQTPTPFVDPTNYNGLADTGIIEDFLTPKACIEDAAIVNYLDVLQKDSSNPKGLEFAQINLPVPNLDFSTVIETGLKAKQLFDVRNDILFALPLLEQGHFKLVLVNFEKHEVYYYDAYGNNPSPATDIALKNLMLDLNESIKIDDAETNKTPWSLDISTVRHQQDGHNCGPFVLKCIHDVVSGKSFEDYKKTNFTDQKTVSNLREEFLAYYLPKMEEVERARLAALQPVQNPVATTSSSDSEDSDGDVSDSTSSYAEELDDL